MMQRIDLAPMLRDTVATPYSDMVTRSTGAALRNRIEQTIAGVSHRTTQLDFTAIGLLDFSCADEVVAKLLLRVADEDEHFAAEDTEAQVDLRVDGAPTLSHDPANEYVLAPGRRAAHAARRSGET